MSELGLKDRVAVITGAGGGLGKAYAILLASLGAKVIVNDFGGSFDGIGSGQLPAQKVVDEILDSGGIAVASFDSVSEWSGAQKIIETAVDAFGKIDILINNAGILRDKTLVKMELEDYKMVLRVHLDGTFYCTKAAFAYMRDQSYGRIVSTASTSGLYGNFGQVNYGAAKMGIAGLMNCVKQEGARYNIGANTIVPNAGTRMTATVMPPELAEKLKPELIAPMVAWLCSEQCNVSGKMFTAGGGYFSTAKIIEGPGVFFQNEQEINVHAIGARIGEIMSVEGGREFESAFEHTSNLFTVISQ